MRNHKPQAKDQLLAFFALDLYIDTKSAHNAAREFRSRHLGSYIKKKDGGYSVYGQLTSKEVEALSESCFDISKDSDSTPNVFSWVS